MVPFIGNNFIDKICDLSGSGNRCTSHNHVRKHINTVCNLPEHSITIGIPVAIKIRVVKVCRYIII